MLSRPSMNRRAVATPSPFPHRPQLRFACLCRSITSHDCVSLSLRCPSHNKTHLLTLWRNEFNRQPRSAAAGHPLGPTICVLPQTGNTAETRGSTKEEPLVSLGVFAASILAKASRLFKTKSQRKNCSCFFVICACQNNDVEL